MSDHPPNGSPARTAEDGPTPSTAAERSRDRYRRATLTSLAAIGARGVAALTALVTVPLTLSYLGPERYGMWMTISSLISFLIFTDLGIGNGVLTAAASAIGRGDRQATSRLMAGGTWILVAVAGVLAALLLASYALVDWGEIFNVSDPVARAEAGPTMAVFGLLFAASLPLTVVAQMRYAHQEGYLNSAFVAAGNLLGLVLVLVAILLELGLPYLVLGFLGAPLLASVANAALLVVQRPWLRPSLGLVDRPTASALLRSGWMFLVLQVALAVGFYADTLIAATVVGPIAAAEYSVVAKLFLPVTVLAAAGLGPLWPAYSEAIARGDAGWVRATFRRSLLLAAAITVPLSAVLMIAAGPLLTLWIGDAVVPPGLLIVAMGAWTAMSAVGTAMAMLLNGLHLLRFQVGVAVGMALVNVPLSVYLATRIGVSGVILGTVVAYPLSTLLPTAFYVRRVLGSLPARRTESGEAA